MPAVTRDRAPAAARGTRGGSPSTGSKAKREDGGARQGKLGGRGGGLQPQVAFIAAAVVLLGGVALMLATGGRAHALQQSLGSAAARELASAGFQVKAVDVEGSTGFSAPYILRAAGVDRGTPMFGLDLAKVRERVERVGWVKSVRILRLMPDTLVIAVAERARLAVWQVGGQSHVIDPDGQIIPEADPGLFVDLPLIVGDGANESAASLLPEIQSRPRLMSRLEALVRVDARRWDLRLKDGSLIQLPAQGEDSALIQLDQLDQKNRLLDLGFERIDLRDPEMIAVRPRQPTGERPALATSPLTPAADPPATPAPAATALPAGPAGPPASGD